MSVAVLRQAAWYMMMANESSDKDLKQAPYLMFILLLRIYAVAALAIATFVDFPAAMIS